jgi:hypothetical protein
MARVEVIDHCMGRPAEYRPPIRHHDSPQDKLIA